MTRIERPASSEYASFFEGYVSRAPDLGDAVGVLGAQRDQVIAALGPLTDAAADSRYAVDKWTIKEMLGHITDAERIFAYRLLCIARGERTPLPGFDENEYVRTSGAGHRPLASLIDDWRAARDSTIMLAAGLPADAWTRAGTANGQPISARALLYVIVGHVAHHLHVLKTRYGVRV